MSLSASFLGDCCFPDINSRSLVAEICAGSPLTTASGDVGVGSGPGDRARTGAGEEALMTMVAGTTVPGAGRGEATG